MINQQLLTYIKQQLQQGINNEQIKQSLIIKGWQVGDIEKAFSATTKTLKNPYKRSWKRIILIITSLILVLIIIILILPFFLSLFAKDIAPIDDSDLQLQKMLIPNEDNAYFYLNKLDDVIYIPEGKWQSIVSMSAGEMWDKQIATEVIYKNAQAFRYFTKAAEKLKYQNPESADPANINFDMTMPPMQSWIRMATLSRLKALYLSKQGKDIEALNESLNSVKIGSKIKESQVMMTEYIMATSLKTTGLITIQQIIPSLDLTNTELKKYIQKLDNLFISNNGLIMVAKTNYALSYWVINILATGDKEKIRELMGEEEPEMTRRINNRFYFKPNKTKLLLAESTRKQIEEIGQLCGEIEDIRSLGLAPANPVTFYITENAIGRILHDSAMTGLTPLIMSSKCQGNLLVSATQTMIAIKMYKNDTNNYPSSLEELVPNYLSSIPIDPFDGNPLRYSAENRIIYSVGIDMKDSGGSIKDGWGWRDAVDPTFVLNF